MTAWELPEIPAEAHGFAVMRILTAYNAQAYQPVHAPGGSDSVRKVLTTARRLGTVRPVSFLSYSHYGLVEVVDASAEPLDGLTFCIPDHQAFLWWYSQMNLTPAEPLWSEENEEWGEDPHVALLLTPACARQVGALLSEAVLLNGLVGDDTKPALLQVIDSARRLIGYAEHDRSHRPEPDEDNTSPLAFLLDREERQGTD